jgi:hypothetical protein
VASHHTSRLTRDAHSDFKFARQPPGLPLCMQAKSLCSIGDRVAPIGQRLFYLCICVYSLRRRAEHNRSRAGLLTKLWLSFKHDGEHRASQWRDRAGFSPASLFSRSRLQRAPETNQRAILTRRLYDGLRALSTKPQQSLPSAPPFSDGRSI